MEMSARRSAFVLVPAILSGLSVPAYDKKRGNRVAIASAWVSEWHQADGRWEVAGVIIL
jgi:hypothetical protein